MAELAPTFPQHPLRAQVLGEVHARPFQRITAPRRLLLHAFAVDPSRTADETAALARWCRETGTTELAPGANFHSASFPTTRLRWERHSEFSTYTWEAPATGGPFSWPLDEPSPVGAAIPAPGNLLVAVDLTLLRAEDAPPDVAKYFDEASLCVSAVHAGAATIATDFRQDARGMVRILVIDHGLAPALGGALVQRLLEIETYRTFALLGLPEAQRLGPVISRVERELVQVAQSMRTAEGLADNGALLDTLVSRAADLEAEAASSSFRFGATRAYDALVKSRLELLGEMAQGGHSSWGAFLDRRMAPAVRTCQSMVDRQADLSKKLERAANLLRTRVDIEMERQNKALLEGMNNRAKLQLRLQQTVEGLSVAAVSYYILGLLGFAFRGAKDANWITLEPTVAVALALPVVLFGVGWTVRRIRARHTD